MDRNFPSKLACPHCDSKLTISSALLGTGTEVTHGSVQCSCYEYPVVDGILVLRQLSADYDAIDPAVSFLREGDPDAARAHLLKAGSMVPHPGGVAAKARQVPARAKQFLDGLVRSRNEEGALSLREDLLQWRPGPFSDYLLYRYGNPSFVAAVAAMSLLEAVVSSNESEPATVLDVSCGIGHSTAMMSALFPDLRFVAADPDFVNLQLLQRHFGGRSISPICIDSEFPLPFSDGQFSATFCLDAFHYIRSKARLARELRRVTRPEGPLILPHLHNKLRPNPAPGIPLTACDYGRLFDTGGAVLFREADVLCQFLEEGTFDVSNDAENDALAQAHAFTLVACPPPLRQKYELQQRLLSAGRRGLILNPAYRSETVGSAVRLWPELPSSWLRAECSAMEQHSPPKVGLDQWQRICASAWSPEDEAMASRLMRGLVLVPVASR